MYCKGVRGASDRLHDFVIQSKVSHPIYSAKVSYDTNYLEIKNEVKTKFLFQAFQGPCPPLGPW